jgi:hypothetical protein
MGEAEGWEEVVPSFSMKIARLNGRSLICTAWFGPTSGQVFY